MSARYFIENGQTTSPTMTLDWDGCLVSFLFFDAGGLPVSVTGLPTVSRSLYDTGNIFQAVNPFSTNEWRFNGPASRVRVSLAGVTGYTTYRVIIWRTANPFDLAPDGAFCGLRAMTFQNYIEANVKNGVQYEVASDNLALAIAGNIDTIFITGANPVVIKSRIVKFNGTHLTTRVYRTPTFTGGTITPYFNLNDRNPVTGSVVIRAGATVSAAGTEFGAPTFDIGSAGNGNSSLSTYTTLGIERILAPNTTYLQRITNDSAAIQEVSSYLSWYEGGTDLPIRAQ